MFLASSVAMILADSSCSTSCSMVSMHALSWCLARAPKNLNQQPHARWFVYLQPLSLNEKCRGSLGEIQHYIPIAEGLDHSFINAGKLNEYLLNVNQKNVSIVGACANFFLFHHTLKQCREFHHSMPNCIQVVIFSF